MDKKLEKLADEMINLTPEESQKLQLIVETRLMPEVAKQQQQDYYMTIIHKCNKWVKEGE